MDVNDPFGRVSRRDQRHYQTFARRLREEGIAEENRLDQFSSRATATFLKLLGLLLCIVAALALVLPAALPVSLLLCGLVSLWASVSYVQTRLYLRRFRRERLSSK